MGEESRIEWTHHTFNPWWGCEKVSKACSNCYAESLAARFHPGLKLWGPGSTRRAASERMWEQPPRWNRAAAKVGERHRVFCASMADVFEDRDDLDVHRHRLFRLIRETPCLDWLLLTKRPDVMSRWAISMGRAWPTNVWAGTTVEDQRRADERIPHLLNVPAPVRFLSMEPLLGPVDLGSIPDNRIGGVGDYFNALTGQSYEPQGGKSYGAGPHLDWLITGGESGRTVRPSDPGWFRSIRDQCASAGVAYFHKQMAGVEPIPDDLRVRQFPEEGSNV